MTGASSERAAVHPVARPVTVVSQPVAQPLDLLDVVAAARAQEPYCFYWERPVEQFGLAALGATQIFTAGGTPRFQRLAAAVAEVGRDAERDAAADRLAAPRFVGGFAFAPHPGVSDGWRGFPPGLMFLPRLLVERRGGEAWLTSSACTGAGARFEALRADAADALQGLISATTTVGPESLPAVRYQAAADTSPLAWERMVAVTLAEIDAGRLQKLVLARSCTVNASRAFDAARIVRRLRHAYPSCIAFWIGMPDGDFLGATPESLVRVDGCTVRTAAIAGTAAPGTCESSARMLGHALRHSGKDTAEHALVVEALVNALAPLCAQLNVAPEPMLLRLENVQHLLTPITGVLRVPTPVLELVARLHPSPAIAGYPRRRALQLIEEREDLDRGWYAGPIGWTDAVGDGEFAVAIRSAVLHGAHASVYAGAGIVAGSDPRAELAETQLKMQPLLSALLEL